MARNCLEFYEEMHKKHPDALLLFRCGDFYQMLNEDARKGARILGITLTYFRSDPKTAMAAFPYHALDTYLPKLIRAGHRVAICDDPEPPKTTKKRGITELVTPKNNETMKLNISNPTTETNNVQNAQVTNPAIQDAEFVEVKEQPKAKKSAPKKSKSAPKKSAPKTNTSAVSPQTSPSYTLVTYQTKKGGTGSYVMGFKTEAEAKALADNACKTIGVTWRYNDKGEKVYALSMGTRYVQVAQDLCAALNAGDKAAVSKAIAQTHDIYAAAVSAGKAEREAKQAEKKAAADKAKADKLEKLKKENGLYSMDEIAAKLRKLLPEGTANVEDIKKILAA